MNNNNSKGVSYTSGFFILIGLSLVALFITSLLALLLLGNVSAMNDPSKAGLLRFIQVVSVVLGMFFPAVLTAYILNRKPFQLLGYREPVSVAQVGLVILIVFVSLLVAGSFGYLNRQIPVSPELQKQFEDLETAYSKQVAIMLDFKTFGGYILSVLIMALVPAMCEETLFRGGLQNFLSRATRRPWLAIIIVSILFSLAHFSFYLFLPRMFLGMVLGSIYYLTRNIWLSITAHFLNNAMAVTQVYLLTRSGKDISTAMNNDLPTYYWGLITLPLLVYLLVVLRRVTPAIVTVKTEDHGV